MLCGPRRKKELTLFMILCTILALTMVNPSVIVAQSATTTPRDEIDFTGDWETGNDEQFGYYAGNRKQDQIAIVTTPVRQGQYAAKFVVRPGDEQPGVPGGERSEYGVPVPSSEKLGDSYYYGWSTLFPADWAAPAGWGVIMNWHAANSLSSPVSVHVRGNKLEIVFHSGNIDNWWPPEYQNRHTIIDDLNKGQWNDFIMKVDWEADWTGNVEVWHRTEDNEFTSVLQVNNIPTLQWSTKKETFYEDRVYAWGDNWYSDGTMKLGLYRGADFRTHYLYHDNINRGTTYSAIRGTFDLLRTNKVEDQGLSTVPTTSGPDLRDSAITQTQAVYGTPVIDGEKDTVWESATSIEVKEELVGKDPATAKLWTMWDEKHVYIYAEIKDPILNAVNKTDWEQDSIEFGVEEVNDGIKKRYSYGVDGGQYRVNFENKRTVHPNQRNESFTQSITKIVEGGYIVEAALPIHSKELAAGMIIGFDVAINDDQGGGRTQAVSGWSENSLNLSDRPLGLGDLVLIGKSSEENLDSAETIALIESPEPDYKHVLIFIGLLVLAGLFMIWFRRRKTMSE